MNQSISQFKLISREGAFNVVKEYLAAGAIPSVKGVSICGKYQTCARLADIEKVA